MSEHAGDIGPTITLPAVMDSAAADTLLATLRQSLAADPSCRLDASKVETLMLPGMQVILAAIRSNAQVRVVDPSPLFCAAFADAALSWVGDDRVCDTAAEPARGPAPADDPPFAADEAPAPSLAAEQDLAPPLAAEEAPAEPAPAADAPPAAKRVLTIDDSKTMRDMLRFTLVDAGYLVLQAVDGQDGLDVLKKEKVDVVITDINMPKLDGYGVIRHLRADASYDDTPILVLSTEGDQKTREIGRDAGATGWLVKPFDPDQLVDIVRQVSP
jgi:two-component system chemotaxis response regulator CheY